MSLLPFPVLENVTSLFVFDRFMDLIGEGSFAFVYRAVRTEPLPARNLPANSPVALKIIPKSKLDSDHAIRDVIKEVEIGRKLDHPGCVPILEVLQSSTDIFLVMELVQGVELFEVIRSAPKGRLPETHAALILAQLLQCVAYLHDTCRVVHRDLKPENILVSGQFDSQDDPVRVRVVDFGLAKYIGTSQRRGRLLASVSGGASRHHMHTHHHHHHYVSGLGGGGGGGGSSRGAMPTSMFGMSGSGTLPPAAAACNNSGATSFNVPNFPARNFSSASVDSLESASSHTGSPLLTTPCGTLKYNAPEAVRNMVVNGAAMQQTTKGDIVKREMYSIGTVAYVMLSGQLPFTAKTKTALVEQMHAGPSFTSARWAHVTSSAQHFVAALLANDPADRPTAARALEHEWLAPHTPQRCRPSGTGDEGVEDDDDDNANVVAVLGRHRLSMAFDAMNHEEEGDDVYDLSRVAPPPSSGAGSLPSLSYAPVLPSDLVPRTGFTTTVRVEEE